MELMERTKENEDTNTLTSPKYLFCFLLFDLCFKSAVDFQLTWQDIEHSFD